MRFRPSDIAIAGMLALSAALVAMFLHATFSSDYNLTKRADLVRQLGLSDLALFTEARYTRHPSQADLHSAFQDHPMSFDYFPSGSLIAPPIQNFSRPAPPIGADETGE
jgi:hypothetical protein